MRSLFFFFTCYSLKIRRKSKPNKKKKKLTTESTDRKPVSNSDRLIDDAVGLPLCRRSYALLSEKSLILALQLLIKANEK